jgi:hypothetical protein
LIFITMSLPEERFLYKEPSSPIGRMQSGLAALFVTPNQKKMDGNPDRAVDDEPFINERKPSSTTAVKGVLNNGEHTHIPVTAKMIHSAIWDCKRFVLKDGRPLHMVKLVGAVRNFRVNKNTYKLIWKMAPDLCGSFSGKSKKNVWHSIA